MPTLGVNPFAFAFILICMIAAFEFAREAGLSGSDLETVLGGVLLGLFIGGVPAYLFSGWGGLIVPAVVGVAGAFAAAWDEQQERELRDLNRWFAEAARTERTASERKRRIVWNQTFDVVAGFHRRYGHFPTRLRISRDVHSDLLEYFDRDYELRLEGEEFPLVILPEEAPPFQAEDDEGRVVCLTDCPVLAVGARIMKDPFYGWEKCEVETR
jgi:hypothetical protein